MNKEAISRSHRKLSACSADFLEYVQNNPETRKRSNFQRLNIDMGYIKLQSWPTFIDLNMRREIEHASVNVCRLIKEVPGRFFSNDPGKISRYYNITIDMARSQVKGINARALPHLLARGDFILSEDGLKCMEYNISSTIGGWQVGMWESLYLETPVISRFLDQYDYRRKIANRDLLITLFQHFIRVGIEAFGSDAGEINTAFVLPAKDIPAELQPYFRQLYSRALHSINPHLRGDIFICDYPMLTTGDQKVFYKEKQVHLLSEMYEGAVPPRFLEVFQAGGMVLFNGPVCGLMSNKLNLAVLSEKADSGELSAGETDIVNKYIPWTRKLTHGKTTYKGDTIDLQQFIHSNRESLVIKPAIGTRGINVFVGSKTAPEKWSEQVDRALRDGGWLVQEYVASAPYLYQSGQEGACAHHAVWGFFVFGGHYGGGWVRLLPDQGNPGVINSSQGAEESVIFEINQEE